MNLYRLTINLLIGHQQVGKPIDHQVIQHFNDSDAATYVLWCLKEQRKKQSYRF